MLGIWMMLQQSQGDDFVLATGEAHPVREFAERAATVMDFTLEWEGEGVHTQAIDRNSGRVIIRVNPDLYRPADVQHLVGDATKAKHTLGWSPTVRFVELVDMMAQADMARAARGPIRS